jgi:hypothetical protein
MNAIPTQIEPATDEAEQVCIVDQVDADPKLLLLGKVDLDAYLTSLRPLVEPSELDLSTKAGRDRIVAKAASVRSRKAAFEKTKLGLTEHWRTQTAKVNATGKAIAERMDELAKEVRAPVTAWEEADKARQAEADRIIADLTAAPTVTFGMTSEQVQERLDRIRGMNLNAEVLGVRIEMATDLRDDAVAALTKAVADLKTNEARDAELAELRAEQERQRIAAQQAEQERIAKERAEAAAKAEAERIERAKVEAAEQAKRAAEEQARREQEERDRAAQAEIDAANARAAEAERLADMERQRIAAEREKEAREREAAEAEQRRREADIAHRQQIIETAAEALTAIPLVTQKMARAIINEIASGNVPNVEVRF